MSDVSVVLLSLGEGSVERAVASLEQQTIQPAEVIQIHNVRPFHRALNQGAERVTTPFFVQLDADMVLDPHCLEALRSPLLAEPRVGVAVGLLRDPLVGRISGVKLFRRACFDDAQFADSISPDTDFLTAIARAGWRDVYAVDHRPHPEGMQHTYGEHRPHYEDVRYTYAKYVMEGARYRYRHDPGGWRWHLRVLERSTHEAAPLALIGLLHGLFTDDTSDLLGRPASEARAARVTGFMQTSNAQPRWLATVWAALARSPEGAFRACHAAGHALAAARAYPTFVRAVRMLASSGAPLRWVAQAGLGLGILADQRAASSIDIDRLHILLASSPRTLGPRRHSLVRALAGWASPRSPDHA